MHTDTRQPITEIVAFRCQPGTEARARALCEEAVAEARSHGGVLGDTLWQSPEDETLFIHQVRWQSLADAQRVAALFPTFACAAAFQDITRETLMMTHARPLWER